LRPIVGGAQLRSFAKIFDKTPGFFSFLLFYSLPA